MENILTLPTNDIDSYASNMKKQLEGIGANKIIDDYYKISNDDGTFYFNFYSGTISVDQKSPVAIIEKETILFLITIKPEMDLKYILSLSVRTKSLYAMCK